MTQKPYGNNVRVGAAVDVQDRMLSELIGCCTQEGAQPVVRVVTERSASGFASGASVLAVDGLEGSAAPRRAAPHLALLLSSFLQHQRSGGDAVASRAARRLGPGHYTAHLLRAGDISVGSAVDEEASLYRLRLARAEQPLTSERLFSLGHLAGRGPTLRIADSFDVDVDIELLPVASGFPAPVDADAWLDSLLAQAQTALRCAARQAVSFHAAARAWTCAHWRLLLALFVTQLALTALLALVVRICPEATRRRQSAHAARSGVVSAADAVRDQLIQPLLPAGKDDNATNPLHDVLIMVKTP